MCHLSLQGTLLTLYYPHFGRLVLKRDDGQSPPATQSVKVHKSVPEIDLSGVTATQKKLIMARANREMCECSHKLTVADCRNDNATCRTSVRLARQMVKDISSPQWTFTVKGFRDRGPKLGPDGTIYVLTGKGVHALDTNRGARKWEFNIMGFWQEFYQYPSTPSIGPDGTIYFGLGSVACRTDGAPPSKVVAVDETTGDRRWEFNTKEPVYRSPVIGADGTVYFVSRGPIPGTVVYALDGKTGASKWESKTDLHVFSSPVIGTDGIVYVGSTDGKVHALDGATGAKKWKSGERKLLNSFASPIIGADGTVHTMAEKKAYALNGKTGAKKWEFEIEGAVSIPAIGIDGAIYIAARKKVYALNGKTGTKEWGFEAEEAVSIPVIGADGTVYIVVKKKAYALDGKTGAKKWEIEAKDAVSVPAIGADGTVYIGTTSKVLALERETGATKKEFPIAEGIRPHSLKIGANGTVHGLVGESSDLVCDPAQPRITWQHPAALARSKSLHTGCASKD